jgi:calcineurin-like phosphoesterase
MRILFLGDIFGRSGREAVKSYLPIIKEKLSPDVIIANVENASHGFGITPKNCR